MSGHTQIHHRVGRTGSSVLTIVAVADIHGDVEAVRKASDALSTADAVLLAGDLTNFGNEHDVARVVTEVRKHNPAVLAIAGNCDLPEVDGYLSKEGINLDGTCVLKEGIAFVGIGWSLIYVAELGQRRHKRFVEKAVATIPQSGPVVLLTHQPPFGTAADLVPSGSYVGSRSLRSLIERTQPLICFTGHIHEGRGVDQIGVTKVINPGPLSAGGYAYAEVSNGQVEVLEIRDVK